MTNPPSIIAAMNEIEEVVSDNYGFKLIDDTSVSEPIDLEQFKNGQELRLLAIHDKQRIIAASNSKSLKFISADTLEEIGTVERDFGITQLYFTESKFYILNNNIIQTLTLDQIKRKDYQFLSLEGNYTNLKPLNDEVYLALDEDGNLYHNSSKIASNVIRFIWHKSSSPIYVTKSDQFQIMGKPIGYDEATKEDLSDLHLVELFSIKDYIFLVYDSSEEQPSDDHQIRTFLLKYEKDEKYTPYAIEIASPYGAAYRTTTYYYASITNWLESTQLQFITSSLSLEIGILDQTNTPPESIVPSEDSNKANYPIDDETLLDVSPIGFAISVHELNSKVDSPCVGVEGEVVGKLPKMYALLDNGKLRSWWVFNKNGILKDKVSLERAIAVEDSVVATHKVENFKKDSSTTDTNAQPPANPFQAVNNPFGASTAGSFKSPIAAASKTDGATHYPTKSAFGSTGFGSGQTSTSAFGSTGFGSGQAPKSSFGSTGFATDQAAKSSFGSTGFGVSTAPATGFGSWGFGSIQKTTATSGKLNLSSGFGKFSNQQPATFENTTSGKNIFNDDDKTSSPFGQSSTTSSPFGKLGSTTGSAHQPLTQAKLIFGQTSASTTTASPIAALGKNATTEGINNTRPTPYADFMESTKESAPVPVDSVTKDELKPLTQKASLPSLQNDFFVSNKTGEDDLAAAFGAIGTNEKPSGVFNSPFGGLKKSNSPAPFALLQKPKESSPFALLQKPKESSPFALLQKPKEASPFANFKTSFTKEEEKWHKDFDNQRDMKDESQISENTPDEGEDSEEAADEAPKDDTRNVSDSLDEFEATENYDLSQDDEEDEVDDQKFVDESEKNDSSWINISKKDATGRVLAQSLVDIEHDGAPIKSKEADVVVEEPVDEPADDPIKPVEFLVFDGFSESLEKSDDPITNKIRTIIANTEGNLQFLAKNVSAVTGYIDAHSTSGKQWHKITEVGNLQYDKEMYKGKLHYLHERETEIEKLNLKLQQSQRDQRLLEKSFSQLVLLEKASSKNLKLLKNRPLEPRKQEMRDRLRKKLANVQSLESKLRTLLMSAKAKSSLGLSTVDKIETIILQLGDQILDKKLALNELEDEMKKLNLGENSKSLTTNSRAAKLELRNRLREMNAKRITQ